MKKIITLMLVLVLAFSFVGCQDKKDEEVKDNTTEVVEEKNGEEAKAEEESTNETIKDGEINVVAAFGNSEDIFAKFTEETGIKVNFLDMSSGEVLARVEAEGGTPVADVWFGGGVDSFISAADKELLEPYVSENTENVPENFKDQNGYWTANTLTVVGFIANEEVLNDKELPIPTTWEELADPKYKGEVIMSDPSISGTNYGVVNCILQSMGEDKGWSYLESLVKNIEYFGKRGSEPSKKTIAGEYGVGITYVDETITKLADTYPVKIVFPEDGVPSAPGCTAIFKNAANLDAAKIFVDWVFKTETQNYLRDLNGLVMVRKDIEPLETLKIPDGKLLTVDYTRFGAERDMILEKWSQMLEQ
jgi:iron(III) transport system substrate-binding protein